MNAYTLLERAEALDNPVVMCVDVGRENPQGDISEDEARLRSNKRWQDDPIHGLLDKDEVVYFLSPGLFMWMAVPEGDAVSAKLVDARRVLWTGSLDEFEELYRLNAIHTSTLWDVQNSHTGMVHDLTRLGKVCQ